MSVAACRRRFHAHRNLAPTRTGKGQHLTIRLLGLAILRLLYRLLRRLIRLHISVTGLVLGLLRRLYGRQLGALRRLLLLRW